MDVIPILDGLQGMTSRGWLGWSSVILVRASTHTLLFDTGNYANRLPICHALAQQGVRPEEIDVVVLSHLHFDHVANVDLFPGATWYVHDQELLAGQQDAATPTPYLQWMIQQPQLERIGQVETVLLPGMSMIHTPGHTAGSCVLTVELDTQTVLLAGDAIKGADAIINGELSAQLKALVAKADVIFLGHGGRCNNQGQPLPDLQPEKHWIQTDHKLEIKAL